MYLDFNKGFILKIFVLLGLFSFSALNALATGQSTKINLKANYQEVYVPVDHLYIPYGFDNNDNVEFVVSGILPSLCHRSPKIRTEIIANEVVITVTSLYEKKEFTDCEDLVIPFSQTVHLGVIRDGQYNVVANKGTFFEKIKPLKIYEDNGKAINQFYYANIEEIQTTDDPQKIILKGRIPKGCFEVKEIKSFDNGSDAISILPIIQKVSKTCSHRQEPYQAEFFIPQNSLERRILLHVRRLDGNSINLIVDNPHHRSFYE